MSHITSIEIEIRDIGALKAACHRMGLTFMDNQRTCRYYRDQMASCDHAILVPGASYEVGVTRNPDGRYRLIWDSYQAGGLVKRLGQNAEELKKAYGIELAKSMYRRKGSTLFERVKEDGTITLSIEGGF